MEIRKCTPEEVEAVGAFYDKVVAWMDAMHANYPKWTYKEYPSVISARACAALGTQYMCLEGKTIVKVIAVPKRMVNFVIR